MATVEDIRICELVETIQHLYQVGRVQLSLDEELLLVLKQKIVALQEELRQILWRFLRSYAKPFLNTGLGDEARVAESNSKKLALPDEVVSDALDFIATRLFIGVLEKLRDGRYSPDPSKGLVPLYILYYVVKELWDEVNNIYFAQSISTIPSSNNEEGYLQMWSPLSTPDYPFDLDNLPDLRSVRLTESVVNQYNFSQLRDWVIAFAWLQEREDRILVLLRSFKSRAFRDIARKLWADLDEDKLRKQEAVLRKRFERLVPDVQEFLIITLNIAKQRSKIIRFAYTLPEDEDRIILLLRLFEQCPYSVIAKELNGRTMQHAKLTRLSLERRYHKLLPALYTYLIQE